MVRNQIGKKTINFMVKNEKVPVIAQEPFLISYLIYIAKLWLPIFKVTRLVQIQLLGLVIFAGL